MDRQRLRIAIEDCEGRRAKVYYDTKGIPTIGVGFNLHRQDAPRLLGAMGVNYANVVAGVCLLTDAQIDALLDVTLDEAIASARRLVADFDSHPDVVQETLVNLVFNIGEGGVRQFHHMRDAIDQHDYDRAADELRDSTWYGQVGRRAAMLVASMRSAATPTETTT